LSQFACCHRPAAIGLEADELEADELKASDCESFESFFARRLTYLAKQMRQLSEITVATDLRLAGISCDSFKTISWQGKTQQRQLNSH
jgi:hypothetical protein